MDRKFNIYKELKNILNKKNQDKPGDTLKHKVIGLFGSEFNCRSIGNRQQIQA